MTFTIAPPSRNPTIDKHLRTVLRFVWRKLVQGGLDDMLPAQVIAYNRTTNLATVQPLIQIVTTLNQNKTRDQITSIPVVQLGGGCFVLNFPVKAGDMGFIKAHERGVQILGSANLPAEMLSDTEALDLFLGLKPFLKPPNNITGEAVNSREIALHLRHTRTSASA